MRSPLAGFVNDPIDMSELYRRYLSLARVELRIVEHRLDERAELVNLLPKHSVGAELGVYTGVFSEYLISQVQPAKIFLVDAWDCVCGGTHYPVGEGWAEYVDHGRISFEACRAAVRLRAQRAASAEVVTACSVAWLVAQPPASLDWVYIDTDHSYETTTDELYACVGAIKPDGMICGDDAWEDEFGVLTAIGSFTADGAWKLEYLKHGQFMLKRS